MQKPFEVVHPHAAGIDIGAKSFYVDAGEENIRVFSTFTADCHQVRDYLLTQAITTVAMESTGVYWVNLYSVLEEGGIEVYLVNGRDAQNVPGRKSDVKDCQWLRQLHSYGLLRKSFIPPATIRQLRSYLRLRQDHIRAAASQVHLMQKALIQMNIRLSEVISDISGASGMRVLKALLAGERNPAALLLLCDTRIVEHKSEAVLKSLQGCYSEEHLFALQQAVDTWQHYHQHMAACDQQMEKLLATMTAGQADLPLTGKRKPIRDHRPAIQDLHQPLLKLTAGKDPTGIAGITDYTFLQLVSEVGTDMSPWASEKHFTSWLKLAPLKASSGKTNRRVTLKRHNKAGQLFRTAAQGILNSRYLALGVFGRRIRARSGSKVAIKAIARKMATLFYRVMTRGEQFVEQGVAAYEKQIEQRTRQHLAKMALQFNLQLVASASD